MAFSCSTRGDWKKLSGTFGLLLRTSPITASPIFILAASCFIKARSMKRSITFNKRSAPRKTTVPRAIFTPWALHMPGLEIVRAPYTISVKRSSELPRWAREICSEVLKGI